MPRRAAPSEWTDAAAGSPRSRGVDRAAAARVLAGAGVLAAGASLASGGVGDTERRAFAALNGGPAWMEAALWAPMQLGSLWGPFAVAAATWRYRRDPRTAAGAVVAGVSAWQLAKVVKSRVRRGRPADLLEVSAQRRGTPSEGLGFVSGHAAVAAALAAVVSPGLGRPARAGAYGLAAVVGAARVQVSAHLPLDVVGGAALGYSLGWSWHLLMGRAQRSSIHAGAASSR